VPTVVCQWLISGPGGWPSGEAAGRSGQRSCEFDVDVVWVLEGQDGYTGVGQGDDLAMLDASLGQVRCGSVEVCAGGDGEADVVKSGVLRVEGFVSDRAESEQRPLRCLVDGAAVELFR